MLDHGDLLYEGISTKIRNMRKRADVDLTQATLAIRVGTSRTTINNIEKGKQRPSLELIYRLANAMKCSYIELFPTDEEIDRAKLSHEQDRDSIIENQILASHKVLQTKD